jgi:lysophospholipase L1-like esterase
VHDLTAGATEKSVKNRFRHFSWNLCLAALLIPGALVSAWAQQTPELPPGAPAPAVPPPPRVASPEEVERLQSELTRSRKTLQDWANLNRYREANAALAAPDPGQDRVVFMGDSITDFWGRGHGQFFPGKAYVNRGISGQTTPQMVIRFRPDVINLHPSVVVILAGTNDIAGNTGPETLAEIEGNLQSIAELAQTSGIRVVLASVTPVCDYIHLQTNRRPPAQITALNQWIRNFCAKHGFEYLDYYTAMVDEHGMLKPNLTYDGLHPNDGGYEVMGPLAEAAIADALKQK